MALRTRTKANKQIEDEEKEDNTLPVYSNEESDKKKSSPPKRDFRYFSSLLKTKLMIYYSYFLQYYQNLKKKDPESGTNDSVFKLKMKEFWSYYSKNLILSLVMTIITLVVLIYIAKVNFVQQEMIVLDKNNEEIRNVLLPNDDVLTNALMMTKKKVRSFKMDNITQNLTKRDFDRGYFECEISEIGVFNVTFNTAFELLNKTCGSNTECNCLSMHEIGMNKSILLLKDNEMENSLVFNTRIEKKSEGYSLVKVPSFSGDPMKIPKSLLFEYQDENGTKKRYTTNNIITSACIVIYTELQK